MSTAMNFLSGISSSQARGLHNFIADIRDAKSTEEECARVNKEIANMRQKFTSGNQLDAYQKKKYVWKMCYIHMLGYDVDFGQVEFISLMAMPRYTEKQCGYMAASLLLRPGDEMITMAINSIRSDLISSVNYAQTLALTAVSNIGTRDIAEAVASDVARLVLPPNEIPGSWNVSPEGEDGLKNKSFVSKKACLCMLKLIRINPDCVATEKMAAPLCRFLECRNVGVVNSALSLINHLVSMNPSAFESLSSYVISLLSRFIINKDCTEDYKYYKIPCPWISVKCLRFLQYLPPPSTRQSSDMLNEILSTIIRDGDLKTDVFSQSNSNFAIIFEAINLIIGYGADGNQSLRGQVLVMLGQFISQKDANIVYLGLDAMIRLAKLDGASVVQAFQATVLQSLKDVDVSVRKRALDLLFVMTDVGNSDQIVGDLIASLETAEAEIKEEIVVKVAILAEKFNKSWEWYVDSMSKVILVAGNYVAEAVWYRIVQIVLLNKDIHEYAAEKMMEIASMKQCNEIAVALSAYLLGEIGLHVCEKPKMSGYEQFSALHMHFSTVSPRVQCILLTSYVKFVNLYPDFRSSVNEVFERCAVSSNLELQQRACEYLILPTTAVIETVLETMPAYAGERANSLYSILEKSENRSDKIRTDISQQSSSESANTSNSTSDHDDPPPPPPKTKLQPTVDLLSIDDGSSFGSSGSTSSSGSVGISPSLEPQCALWFAATCLTPPGQKSILFEDNILRVTVVCEFRSHQGRISLSFYNKASSELNAFKITTTTNPAEAGHLNLRVNEPAVRVSISEDARAQIVLECLRPFAESPKLSVCFSIGSSSYIYDLKLPVLPTSFCEPLQTDKETFMNRWKSISGEGLEVQEVFPSSKPVDATYIAFIRSTVFAALHMGPAVGIDTETTVTGSASLRTGTMGADGAAVAVGCLVRIEANPSSNVFRVTVRAKHPILAQAVRQAFKSVL